MVAIIGILAAVAIPAYQTYQEDAKKGVLESIARSAKRTIALQQSLGKKTTGTNLKSLLSSEITFNVTVSPPTSTGATTDTLGADDKTWCVEIDTEDYGNKSYACIDSNNDIGVDINQGTAPTQGEGAAGKVVCNNTAGVCGSSG